MLLTKLNSIKWWLIGGMAAVAVLSAVAASLYYVAYHKGLNVSEVQISEYQAKVTKLNSDLKTAQGRVNTEYQTQYLDRVVERERIVYRNRDVIVTQVPEQYILSQGWVYAHDQSALGQEIDPDIAANEMPSGRSDREAVQTIAANYAICDATADQLTAFQNWYKAQMEVVDATITDR